MRGRLSVDEYARAIADATARREAQRAVNVALQQQAVGCVEFFEALEACLGQEMRKANEALSKAEFKDQFEGLYVSKPPEYRMIISFGGTPQAREILLDLEDKSSPMIYVSDAKKSPTGSLQFVLKDVGAGLNAYNTEGGGTANWSVTLSPEDVAARTVENVIDGLFR